MFRSIAAIVVLTATHLAAAQSPSPESKPASAQPAASPAAGKPDAAPIAKGPTLKVGDKAPALRVEKFLKGTPITKFEPGNVYIVEFWATWCRPCVKAFPHLTELQTKHAPKGLTIIGVDVREDAKTPYTPETLAAVDAFVKDRNAKLEYTIAYDGGAKNADAAYLKAAATEGIPTAFIIDRRGLIAYIGHPMEMDATLESVLHSTHDIKALAERYTTALEARAAKTALVDKMMGALKTETQDEFYAAAIEIIDQPGAPDPQTLFLIAYFCSEKQSPLKRKDLPLALKAAEKLNTTTGHNEPGYMATLADIHFQLGHKDKASELLSQAIELASTHEDYQSKTAAWKTRLETYR